MWCNYILDMFCLSENQVHWFSNPISYSKSRTQMKGIDKLMEHKL